MTPNAIKKFNLKLLSFPGMDDEVFVLQTDTRLFWFSMWSEDDYPEPLPEDRIIEEQEKVIFELLDQINAMTTEAG
jgi:hypothetical protein